MWSLTIRILIQIFPYQTKFEHLLGIIWFWRYSGKKDMVPDLNEGLCWSKIQIRNIFVLSYASVNAESEIEGCDCPYVASQRNSPWEVADHYGFWKSRIWFQFIQHTH